MALNYLPVPGRLFEVQDGTKYAYVHIAAAASKPTFLLLHGFPSSSYDWRFQIKSLADLGYGVIAPDLLGYGDTDQPAEIEKYRSKKMASDIVQILDKESLGKVIGVGHDWGAGLLSRLVNYHPDRLSALVFVSVPYTEPAPFDLDLVNGITEQAFGYPVFGYWKFFISDDAAEICNRNNESLTSLIYPFDPESWKTHLAPIGAIRAWVTANTIKQRPAWISETEVANHNKIFAKGGYTGPLNWYKAAISGINIEDEAEIPKERKVVDAPTLVVVSDEDYVTRAEMAEQAAPTSLRNYSIKKVIGSGHWIPLEKKDELSDILVEFAVKIGGP